jgi:hypothetical protein
MKKKPPAAPRVRTKPKNTPEHEDELLRRCLKEDSVRGLGHSLTKVERKYWLDTAEANLKICAENQNPLPGEYARVIAEEYFKIRRKPLLVRATKADRDRVTLTAVRAAITRGYSSVLCWDVARQMIVAVGVMDRADLKLDGTAESNERANETIRTRFYVTTKDGRLSRWDYDLLNKFLAVPITDPPKKSP